MSAYTDRSGAGRSGAGDLSVDPRIRARRLQVQHELTRRRARQLMAGSVVAGLAAAGVWTARSPLLDVDRITVVGAARTGDDAVRAALGVDTGDRLVTVPLGRAANRLRSLPWVRTVTVRRSWPGTVAVTVVERTAVAALPVTALDGWILVDETGRQLGTVTELGADVVRLDVLPLDAALGQPVPADYEPVMSLAAALPDRLRSRIVSLRPGLDGEIDGTIDLGEGATATVRFGQPEQLTQKRLALLSVLDTADLRRLATIDVRVPAVPALTRR